MLATDGNSDTLPYCKLQRAQVNDIRDQWQDMGSNREDIKAKFLNMHCLETNFIEGTFQFDAMATLSLTQGGFSDEGEFTDRSSPIGGAVRNRVDGLSILRDTHTKALTEIFTFLEAEPLTL